MNDDIRRLFELAEREMRPEFRANLLELIDAEELPPALDRPEALPDEAGVVTEIRSPADLGRRRRWRLPTWLGVAAAVVALLGGLRLQQAQQGDGPRESPLPSATADSVGGPVTASTTDSTNGGPPSTAETAPVCISGQNPAVGAVDLATGAIEWSACSPAEAHRTIIGATETLLLLEEIIADTTYTVAVDPAEGRELWRRSTARVPIPRGSIDGQGIVVLSIDDSGAFALIGVDALTGEERWRLDEAVTVIGQSDAVVVVAGQPPTSAPQTNPTDVHGIDRATGAERWASDVVFHDPSAGSTGRGAAAVWENVIALPTGVGLAGVDMSTGAQVWSAPLLGSPEAAEGIIVGAPHSEEGTGSPSITALDATTGQQVWAAPGQPSYGGLLAVGDGALVVRAAGSPELVAYELSTGAERWRVPSISGAEPQLVVGTSAVLLWEGDLAVLSTTDGSTTWALTQPFGSTLMNSVGSNETTVFVAINSVPFGD